MQLSLFSDYSLRVLMFAAVKGDIFQLEEVTTAFGISGNHVAKVVHSLSKLGYLETRRGRGGGARLALRAEEIQIGQLLRKTENQPVFVECFDGATNRCVISGTCALKGVLREALNSFYSALDRHTLSDLVSGPHRRRMSNILLTRS